MEIIDNNSQKDICLVQEQNNRQDVNVEEKINISIKLLPMFKANQPYEIFFINRKTSFKLLSQLNEEIKQTQELTLFTQDDTILKKQYAIVVVMFEQHDKLNILIFEMFHLPYYATKSYCQIRDLFDSIFFYTKATL
ncbi:unnamed protein product [Rotaria sordida]|nr:unnamed protein product [Rotaria sordida]CAF0968958.1 unnamed protein product [Rotaria sordida]CAF1039816.1 unnamed protein product [Rotaria sordida]CAF1040857.1 unnamed protein product [Rotaria sordida]CAF1194600.1 unnamed protein product [Rotaria sordida]